MIGCVLSRRGSMSLADRRGIGNMYGGSKGSVVEIGLLLMRRKPKCCCCSVSSPSVFRSAPFSTKILTISRFPFKDANTSAVRCRALFLLTIPDVLDVSHPIASRSTPFTTKILMISRLPFNDANTSAVWCRALFMGKDLGPPFAVSLMLVSRSAPFSTKILTILRLPFNDASTRAVPCRAIFVRKNISCRSSISSLCQKLNDLKIALRGCRS